MEEVKNYLNNIRRDFAGKPLSEGDTLTTPVLQFNAWLDEAVGSEVLDPHAMVVATHGTEGVSQRVVYVRDVEENALVFYTNYLSQKGREVEIHPEASILFHWGELERQIRMEGHIEKVSAEMSDAYFNSRPRSSQIGAWASEQSSIIESRSVLEKRVVEFTQKFEGVEVPRPPHWGGYRLIINKAEFWQGRPSRLHDRIVFLKEGDSWKKHRVAP